MRWTVTNVLCAVFFGAMFLKVSVDWFFWVLLTFEGKLHTGMLLAVCLGLWVKDRLRPRRCSS